MISFAIVPTLLIIILGEQTHCSAATDETTRLTRKRRQKLHSHSDRSAHLRGAEGRPIRAGDEYDPFIGIQRELVEDDVTMQASIGQSMSLSTTTAPTPTDELFFIVKTDGPALSPATNVMPASSKPTLLPTLVYGVDEAESFLLKGTGVVQEEIPPTPKPSPYPTYIL